MARLLDDAATEYLNIDQSPIVSYPFVIACRFNSDIINTYQTLISIVDKDVYPGSMYSLSLSNDTKVWVRAYKDPAYGNAKTSTTYSVNTWHHACAIFASATDRRVLLDNGGKVTNATNVTPVNLDRTTIGYDRRPTSWYPMSGMIAEAAIWDLSVWPGATGADKANNFERIIGSLANGDTPNTYPLGLVAYWDLIRSLNDKFGGYNLTANGTVVAAHPRIIQPHSPL